MFDNLCIKPELKKLYYEKGYWGNETILDVWHKQADRLADHEYVADDQGTRFTYGEVEENASKLAAWLVDKGIEPGDVVSFQMPTWSEFCIIYVAALKVGAIMHPLARNFNDTDLEYNMKLVQTRAFICATHLGKVDFEAQALSFREKIPSLDVVVLVDKASPKKSDLPTLNEILSSTEAMPREGCRQVSPDDVACILTTSGTTGKSKAALLTHNNVLFSERVYTQGFERTENDVCFTPIPLNHAMGFFHGLISPMLLGGRSVLQQDFNAQRAIELINEEKCTWSMGPTPIIYDILKAIQHDGAQPIPSLDIFVCGGAPVPAQLVQCARKQDILLCEVYGSTESCPHVYVPPKKCLEWSGAWSGIPFPGIEIRVVDSNGDDVPCGIQGEELSRGPHLFVGYLNEPERTARALDSEGWFHSGDLGYLNEEGVLRINGRKKEVIIRGGENICAREVDDNLVGCPNIRDTATIGMPDERLGECICTFAVAADGTAPTLDDVKAYLQQKHVAKRLWPERLELIDAIPLSPTCKVKRFELAKELERRMARAS